MIRLITIPISHYCEKARWALDRADIAYREDRHLQIFHYLAVKRAGGGISVPALVTDDAGTLRDSTDILAWVHARKPGAGLYPTDPAARRAVDQLEELFDETLGPATRRVIYSHLLPEKQLAYQYNCTGVPALERRLLPLVYPAVALFLRKRLDVTADRVTRDMDEIGRVFDEVDRLLADGRRYLCGGAFSAADLTFAALAAPVLLPAEYGVPLPRLDEIPHAMRELVEAYRRTTAGAFCLRLYAEERATARSPAP